MSLRILHIMSSNFFAGSVAYALQVAEYQQQQGHKVFMATDQSGLSDSVKCFQVPVADRSMLQRFRNVRAVRAILREQSINVIHAHSRAASWIAHYAARGSRTCVVSTIHGRQVRHSRLKADVYGEKVIAICSELAEQLTTDLMMNSNRVSVLPNPFDFSRLKSLPRSWKQGDPPVITVVGRLNGPKGDHVADLVANVFPVLLSRFKDLVIQLAGGEWESFPDHGKKAFKELQQLYGTRIRYLGFTRQILDIMAGSTIVVGAGRVALEALGMGIPVFAIGEACCHGFVTPANIESAISTNFGDIKADVATFVPDIDRIAVAMENYLKGGDLEPINYVSLVNRYDLNFVMPEIMSIYSAAIMRRLSPRPIPILMYHRVPLAPILTRHKTFVTAANFARHLQFFSWRGLQSLTFKDYLAFSTGDRPASEFPRKPFILTFDDGYRDNFTIMLPLAERYGYRGVLFLLGDATAEANFWDQGEQRDDNLLMTAEQRSNFVAKGWEVGAHTLSHPNLGTLDDNMARYEITESKRCLEEELGAKTISFAYPFGHYSLRTKALVKEAGFSFGIATDSGGITIEDDRFAVFRVNMFPNETIFSLFKKTSSWYRTYYFRKRGK